MGLTKDEAYTILELPFGANQDEVRCSYKRLALKWHPDKHANSPESTKKFQEVSSAYKRLTSNDSDDEINLTPADMFDLFAHIFFHRNGMFGCYPGRPMYDSDDTYYSDDDDEDDDDDLDNESLHNVASNLRRKYEKRSTDKSSGSARPAHNLSEAEAMKNAKELIEEEERDRKKAEKRRAKKKRNKERKREREREREKKEKDEKENIQQKNIKKENIPTSSKTLSKDSDKKNKSTSNVPSTPNKTVNSNTKLSNGLKEQCANSTNLQQHGRTDKTSNKRHDDDNVSGGEEPSWDTSSAFFNRAAGRNPTSAPTPAVAPFKSNNPTVGAQTSTNSKSVPGQQAQTDQIDPVVLRSRQVAVKGNEMANQGNYPAAVDLFTEAINLDAKDFRFFGNRSYCYDRMNQYEKALQDADVAISLAPDWPKGYFRRGRALAGLKLFSDAESSFAQVLKLDKHCEDAMFELARVRMQQLEEMGFPQSQSEAAIQAYGTVQAALEALLAGKVNLPQAEEIYVSDVEDNPRKPTSTKPVEHETSSDGPCRSLWVGNINPDQVGERHLLQLFSRCGRVDNVRILPKRFCAFVNYERAESANLALENLQGFELGGEQILLRYPNNSGMQLGTQALTSNPSVLPKRKPTDT